MSHVAGRDPSFIRRNLPCIGLLLVALGACDEKPVCFYTLYDVELAVVDPLGNPLSVEAASLQLEDERVECSPINARSGRYRCSVASPGTWQAEISTQGTSASYELSVFVGPECTLYANVNRVPITLTYDGPLCELDGLIALEGDLRDSSGMPLTGRVSVFANSQQADCDVTDGHYLCPAIDPVTQDYRVTATFGVAAFSQSATVDVDACGVGELTIVDFDMATWVCPEERDPAGRVQVYIRDPERGMLNALADEVTVQVGDGEVLSCELEPEPDVPGPRAYLCPSPTRFGVGEHVFKATRNGVTREQRLSISSVDCEPSTENVSLVFDG